MMKLFLIISTLIVCSFSIECLNEQGRAVDWWVILKLPYESSTGGDHFRYCDAKDGCQTIRNLGQSITSIENPLLRTLGQASKVQVSWNDQEPDGKTITTGAHSKGLVFADPSDESGIIINHSVPQFPVLDENRQIILQYPSNGFTYGQHMACFSTTMKQLDEISSQYMYAKVNLVSSNVNEEIKSQYPNLYSFATLKSTYLRRRSIQQLTQNLIITTKGGQQLHFFSKKANENIDFYEVSIVPVLQVSFAVETWGNGVGGLEEPTCNQQFQVVSNLYIQFPDGVNYKYTKDHSKYGISKEASKPYVCMSDINRQISQRNRGGTAICFLNSNLWGNINKMFVSRQEC